VLFSGLAWRQRLASHQQFKWWWPASVLCAHPTSRSNFCCPSWGVSAFVFTVFIPVVVAP
jgi:hypothetical protein